MSRTDKEIAEYVRYYAQNNQRKWAVEMLTKTEGKTAEEIEHICKAENGKLGVQTSVRKPPKYSDVFIDAVAADRGAGMSYKDIADKYKMSEKTINSIFAIISRRKKKAVEAEMKQQEQAAKELLRDAFSREPEAYPGQIYDDPEPAVKSVDETAEPVDESDVKIFLPGEKQEKLEEKKIPYKKPEIIQPPKLPARDCRKLWQELAEQLADFAVGTFGARTDVTSMYWNENPAQADVEFRTADGKRISIHMEEFA